MFYYDDHDIVKLLLEKELEDLQEKLEDARYSFSVSGPNRVFKENAGIRLSIVEYQIDKTKEFYDNNYTQHYIISENTDLVVPENHMTWCKENLGYSPLLVKVDSKNIALRTTKTALLLFKSQEDIVAFKLRWI